VPSAVSYSAAVGKDGEWYGLDFSLPVKPRKNVQHTNDRSPELHLPPLAQKVLVRLQPSVAYLAATLVMVGLSQSQR
jgi:hypothetical protein